MTEPFRPAWWLGNAHLQTLWGPLLRRRPLLETTTERWEMDDGDCVAIERLAATSDAPRLVLLHGLEGSSRSHYIQGLLVLARSLGWGGDVLVFRGCGGEPNRAKRFYHSGETSDLETVLHRLSSEHSRSPLLLCGFSLGGNVLLKWLGERGADAPPEVVAAAAVSVPYDLERGARHLHRGFARIYERNFLRSLVRKAVAKRALHPGLPDESAIAGVSSIHEFDDVMTAPVHGFCDASDYYSRSSSIRYLDGVRRPTLLLSARDDPFLPEDVLEEVSSIVSRNGFLSSELLPHGGHCGFVEGGNPLRPRYYAERRVLRFLQEALTAFRAASPAHSLERP